ncbi:MAG TPA: glycosyltransferase family 4 protein [Firmicutes bacterium]|nr:glycosyltransferase family 4 protein [Bacillota bacterium]
MHVLLTTYLVRSGVLTHVWDLVQQLPVHGIDVTVAILQTGDEQGGPEPGSGRDEFTNLLGPIGRSKYFFFRTADDLSAICREQKIQLLHAHSRLAYPASQAVAKRLGIPLVLTLHGVFPWQEFYPSTLKQARAIIAVGPAQAAGTEPVREKVVIIPNGIDTQYFRPLPSEPRRRGEELHIIWFGRTNGASSRGVTVLDRAVYLLRSRGFRIKATLIGKAADVFVHEFETLDWVSDPLPYLQSGHLAFGHGRALREAMSCGNVGFLLGHGYGGRVEASWFAGDDPRPVSAIPQYNLPKPDAEIIAADIARFYHDERLLEQARIDARLLALCCFDVQEMIRKTIAVYENCQTPK